jgi:hypothetical protein
VGSLQSAKHPVDQKYAEASIILFYYLSYSLTKDRIITIIIHLPFPVAGNEVPDVVRHRKGHRSTRWRTFGPFISNS